MKPFNFNKNVGNPVNNSKNNNYCPMEHIYELQDELAELNKKIRNTQNPDRLLELQNELEDFQQEVDGLVTEFMTPTKTTVGNFNLSNTNITEIKNALTNLKKDLHSLTSGIQNNSNGDKPMNNILNSLYDQHKIAEQDLQGIATILLNPELNSEDKSFYQEEFDNIEQDLQDIKNEITEITKPKNSRPTFVSGHNFPPEEIKNIYNKKRKRNGKVKLGLFKNTYILKNKGNYIIKLYDTDIVTIKANNDIILNSGGYKTYTTKNQINMIIDDLGYIVFQRDKKWLLGLPDGDVVDFYDGITLHTETQEVTGYNTTGNLFEGEYEKDLVEYEESVLEKEYVYGLELLENYLDEGFTFEESLYGVIEQEQHLDPILLRKFAIEYGFDKEDVEEEIVKHEPLELTEDDVKYLEETGEDF